MKHFYSFITAALLMVASQSAFAQWKPTSGKYYDKDYNTQEWVLREGYLYSYDTAGNMTMAKGYTYEADEGEAQVTGPFFQGQAEYTYDATNRLTGYVAKYVDDYGSLREAGSCTIAYDATDTDIITSFERTGTVMTFNDYAPKAYYRQITRDANGNITQILISGYFNNKLMDIERVTMTYKDNKPVTFKEETKLADPDGDDVSEGIGQVTDEWQPLVELTDIEWESTGKHLYLVTQDPYLEYETVTKQFSQPYEGILEHADGTNWLWFTKIVEGDYLIKSATYKQTIYGYTVKASLKATYDNNGGYYLKVNAGETTMEIKKEYTDKYGSYKYIETDTEDGEVDYIYNLTETKDEHGNTTAIYTKDSDDGNIDLDTYVYTYDKDTGELTSVTTDDNMYVYGDFIDVKTGISKVTADSKNYPTSIFDISGRKVGTSLDNLKSHKGLLIVKQGGKTKKMMVK